MAGSNGDVWIGTQEAGAFYRLRAGQLQAIPVPPGSGSINTLAEDAGGVIWAATTNGLLMRVRGDAAADATPGNFAAPEPIRCLHATPDGSLWIGYETRGLGRLKQGEFCLFGERLGLADDAVSQILLDCCGWLWCAGDRGIIRVKLAELEAIAAGKLALLHPIRVGCGEGWPVLRASADRWPRAMRSRTGELWLSTNIGLAVIRPELKAADPPPPIVVIEQLNVNGRFVASYENRGFPNHGVTAPVADLHGLTERLALGRGVRQLSVEYNVVSFTGRENVRYRYRLQGLDDTWVDAGPQRVAFFSQVPPGDYQFQVSACNNEGIWNETGAALALTVMPFFWQTTWFKAGCLAASTGFLVGTGWWGARRRARRRLAEMAQANAIDLVDLDAVHPPGERLLDGSLYLDSGFLLRPSAAPGCSPPEARAAPVARGRP